MNRHERPTRFDRVTGSRWFALACLLLVIGSVALWRRSAPSTVGWLCCHARCPGVLVGPDDGRILVYVSKNLDRLVAEGRLGEDVALPPGSYDTRVVFQRLSADRSKWLRDLSVDADRRTEREIEFSAGELSVEATVANGSAGDEQVIAYVFRPGNHDQPLTSMRAGQAVLLPTGKYDLRVVLTVDTAEKDVRWLRDSEVREGLRSEHRVSFERGALLVRATNADEATPQGAVELTIFRADDVQEEVVDSGWADIPLALPPGNYDARATFTASHDKPVRWLRDVNITSGETVEESAEFSLGSVVVEARLQAGDILEPFAAYVYYYRPGDHEQAIAYMPAGQLATLESGVYVIRGEFFRSHDRPSIWLRDVEIQPGEVVHKTIEFPSGKILVRAYDGDGKELVGDNVFVSVHPKGGGGPAVAQGRSGELITLTAGKYEVRAEDTRGTSLVPWTAEVEIQPGQTVQKTATFRARDATDGPRSE